MENFLIKCYFYLLFIDKETKKSYLKKLKCKS